MSRITAFEVDRFHKVMAWRRQLCLRAAHVTRVQSRRLTINFVEQVTSSAAIPYLIAHQLMLLPKVTHQSKRMGMVALILNEH